MPTAFGLPGCAQRLDDQCAQGGFYEQALCDGNTWSSSSFECIGVQCGNMNCKPGQICVEKTFGFSIEYSCEDDPCGTQPLSCACAEQLCGGDPLVCTNAQDSTLYCDCLVCL